MDERQFRSCYACACSSYYAYACNSYAYDDGCTYEAFEGCNYETITIYDRRFGSGGVANCKKLVRIRGLRQHTDRFPGDCNDIRRRSTHDLEQARERQSDWFESVVHSELCQYSARYAFLYVVAASVVPTTRQPRRLQRHGTGGRHGVIVGGH